VAGAGRRARPRQAGEADQHRGLAYYECEHCKAEIRDHHKPRMLRRGVWASEDQVVTPTAAWSGPSRGPSASASSCRALLSPWVTFGQLAKEWVEAQGDPQALCDFINQRLAEPFEEQRAKTEPDFIAEKAKGRRPRWSCRAWARAADRDGRHAGQQRAGRLLLVRRSARGATTTAASSSTTASAQQRRARERCLTGRSRSTAAGR
jgi:hypothetical protein